MHISALRISNFRRLKSVLIDFAEDISILVGSNNSGKTSTAHALQLFLNSSREQFSIHDFHSECWAQMDAFGENAEGATLPTISIDIWINVVAADLHRVIDLLPSLTWQGSQVGVCVEFAAKDDAGLLARFQEARVKAQANARTGTGGAPDYVPPPHTMSEYLKDALNEEFGLRYFVLDRARFDAAYLESPESSPRQLTPEKGQSGRDVLNSLIRIDVLSAQRHLSDRSDASRAEDLSRHLGRFYKRNLEQRQEDHDAMRALFESETSLNEHLARVFEPTLQSLSHLGYPGLANPRLMIKSALNPAAIMSGNDEGTKVYYALNPEEEGDELLMLPDRYNGLGFKNLIYMVVELLDRHSQWIAVEENRPPLHLIFIEEPEVHLHAQLQQVFIRNAIDLVKLDGEDAAFYRSQIVVTTHSPHILYERGFRPVRYFRRVGTGAHQSSEVLNLSAFYDRTEEPIRDFLERYLKLTHCDLFFADAALLVEGNVERLLMPQMIEKAAPALRASCLCVLEVGGAFAYRFRTLLDFLGLTTLIITDLDSVSGTPPTEATGDGGEAPASEDIAEDRDEAIGGKACLVDEEGAVTSNQTLIQWLPGRTPIGDLLTATAEERTQVPTNGTAMVRVTYQGPTEVTWRGTTLPLTGRTFEEAFALENLRWVQDVAQKELQLRIARNETLTLQDLRTRIHNRVKKSGFKKTDFALALLSLNPMGWVVPRYIAEGLRWLEEQTTPPDGRSAAVEEAPDLELAELSA